MQSDQKNYRRYVTAYILLIVLIGFFLSLNICIGSVNISFSEVLDILRGHGADSIHKDIVMQIRFPRCWPGRLCR